MAFMWPLPFYKNVSDKCELWKSSNTNVSREDIYVNRAPYFPPPYTLCCVCKGRPLKALLTSWYSSMGRWGHSIRFTKVTDVEGGLKGVMV